MIAILLLLAAAGIRTFINLADTPQTILGFTGFGDTYYSRQQYLH